MELSSSSSCFFVVSSLAIKSHGQSPGSFYDNFTTQACSQGVNLLCREGNSQPGHWMTMKLVWLAVILSLLFLLDDQESFLSFLWSWIPGHKNVKKTGNDHGRTRDEKEVGESVPFPGNQG